MPYIGNKYRSDNRLITVKVFGPDSTFDTTSNDIKEILDRTISSSEGVQQDELVTWIANNVAYNIKTDKAARWVECEVMYADGSLYGGVAELEAVG